MKMSFEEKQNYGLVTIKLSTEAAKLFRVGMEKLNCASTHERYFLTEQERRVFNTIKEELAKIV